MKIVALIGEPASGKTTLAREVIAKLGPGTPFKTNLLRGTRHGKNVFVFGEYSDETFSGTDRLSMAVQPDAERFIWNNAKTGNAATRIFFEGDRLGNLKFFDACAVAADLTVFVLRAENVALRQAERSPKQNPTFLKSRATKIANIETRLTSYLHELVNDTPRDLERNARRIMAALR